MGRMAELYEELKNDEYQFELDMYAYQEWVAAEMEKEVNTTYQLNKTEQNALNTYMEGSHAFYTSNDAVPSSSDVFKLHNRKTKRSRLSTTDSTKNKKAQKEESSDHGQEGSRSTGDAPWSIN